MSFENKLNKGSVKTSRSTFTGLSTYGAVPSGRVFPCPKAGGAAGGLKGLYILGKERKAAQVETQDNGRHGTVA